MHADAERKAPAGLEPARAPLRKTGARRFNPWLARPDKEVMTIEWTKTSALLRGLLVSALAALAFAQGPRPGSEPPKLHGQTLDGKAIVLPDAAAGKVTVLLVGASKEGGERTRPWKEHFVADFGSNPHVSYYVAALLQSAPAIFRGVIRAGMRNGTPVSERPQVLTSGSDEAAWKKYLAISEYSLPGVLLLDETGHLQWSYNGKFDPEHYESLKTATTAALQHR